MTPLQRPLRTQLRAAYIDALIDKAHQASGETLHRYCDRIERNLAEWERDEQQWRLRYRALPAQASPHPRRISYERR